MADLRWLKKNINIYMIVDQEHFQRFWWEEGGANFDSEKRYGCYMQPAYKLLLCVLLRSKHNFSFLVTQVIHVKFTCRQL